MHKVLITAALCVALAPGAAAARITIDDLYLACTLSAAEQPGASPQTTHLRVADGVVATWDEASGAWFRNACDVPQGVEVIYRRCAITEDRIYVVVSYRAGTGALASKFDGETVIDRQTGHLTRISRMTTGGKSVPVQDETGQCERSDAHRGAGPVRKF